MRQVADRVPPGGPHAPAPLSPCACLLAGHTECRPARTDTGVPPFGPHRLRRCIACGAARSDRGMPHPKRPPDGAADRPRAEAKWKRAPPPPPDARGADGAAAAAPKAPRTDGRAAGAAPARRPPSVPPPAPPGAAPRDNNTEPVRAVARQRLQRALRPATPGDEECARLVAGLEAALFAHHRAACAEAYRRHLAALTAHLPSWPDLPQWVEGRVAHVAVCRTPVRDMAPAAALAARQQQRDRALQSVIARDEPSAMCPDCGKPKPRIVPSNKFYLNVTSQDQDNICMCALRPPSTTAR